MCRYEYDDPRAPKVKAARVTDASREAEIDIKRDRDAVKHGEQVATVLATLRLYGCDGSAELISREIDRERSRADRAEAREANAKATMVTPAEAEARRRAGCSAHSYPFAVVYRALDGFTENRRRLVIGPFSCAWSRDAEIERNRRPCERVHSVERLA